MRSSYDELADTLYISVGVKVRARAVEDDFGIVWRTTSEGIVIGATVQALHRWASNRRELANRLSDRLPASWQRIEEMLPL